MADKLCFVVGPIGDPGTDIRRHADWLLKGIIKPVFAQSFPDYRVERADEIVAPGSINSQVITRLMDAELVIADMSMHNANAFYELAIRHMVRLPTIHIIQRDWKVPFDVAPFRAIQFARDDVDDLEAAKAALKITVEEAIKDGFQVENPITHARGIVQLEEHATPAQKVLLDRLQAIEERLTTFDFSGRTLEARGEDGPSLKIYFDKRLGEVDLYRARDQVEELAKQTLPVRWIGSASNVTTILLMPVIGARATLERFAENVRALPTVVKSQIET